MFSLNVANDNFKNELGLFVAKMGRGMTFPTTNSIKSGKSTFFVLYVDDANNHNFFVSDDNSRYLDIIDYCEKTSFYCKKYEQSQYRFTEIEKDLHLATIQR